MKKKVSLLKHLPLLLLVLIMLSTIYNTFYSEYLLMNKHYISIGLISVACFLLTMKNNISFYFTGFILILGTLNLIGFSITITKKEFGLTLGKLSFGLNFQPLSFYIFIFWLILFLLLVNKKI